MNQPKEFRRIPIFYRDRDIIKSKQSMVHYLKFLIDMKFFELSGSDKIKNIFINSFGSCEYDYLSKMIETLNENGEYIDGINIYETLSRCYFCASPIDPKDYKTIMERLEKHKDKNYHQYYLITEAYVNDYDYEISETFDVKKIKDKWNGINPVNIYQVLY